MVGDEPDVKVGLPAFDNLEAALSYLVTLVDHKTDHRWEQGDAILDITAAFTGRGVIEAIAGVLGCSSRHVLYLKDVAAAFPDSVRYADNPWGWHKVVYQAAQRHGVDVHVLAEECCTNSAAAVRAMSDLAQRLDAPMLDVVGLYRDRKLTEIRMAAAEQATTICPKCGWVWETP